MLLGTAFNAMEDIVVWPHLTDVETKMQRDEAKELRK